MHIGNFVEVKNASIANQSKANHLAYIGDAQIGERVNVGAGTITCNYDGANKHLTIIEDDVFIGSDTQLVAPVTVKKGATLGAGTTPEVFLIHVGDPAFDVLRFHVNKNKQKMVFSPVFSALQLKVSSAMYQNEV